MVKAVFSLAPPVLPRASFLEEQSGGKTKPAPSIPTTRRVHTLLPSSPVVSPVPGGRYLVQSLSVQNGHPSEVSTRRRIIQTPILTSSTPIPFQYQRPDTLGHSTMCFSRTPSVPYRTVFFHGLGSASLLIRLLLLHLRSLLDSLDFVLKCWGCPHSTNYSPPPSVLLHHSTSSIFSSVDPSPNSLSAGSSEIPTRRLGTLVTISNTAIISSLSSLGNLME